MVTILRLLCGALQKLEEFNRNSSVRSIAGRRAAIVRAPDGQQVHRAGAVRVPCGGVCTIASVHDEDDPVRHDVQVVSGVVGE